MAVTIPGLAIKIDGDASGLEKTLAEVKGGIGSLLGPATFSAISSGITAAIASVDKVFQGLSSAIGLAERGLAKFINTADRLGKLEDLAAQLNVGVGDIVGLNRGAKIAGSSGDDLQSAILKMRGNLGDAMAGGKDPFSAIGLSLRGLIALNSTGQLGEVFDALNKITDPARRQAAGEDIFGKMFKSIELLSRGGSGGIRGLISDSERLGIVLDGALLEKIGRTDDVMADVRKQFEAISDKAVGAFAPALERASISIRSALAEMSKEGGAIDRYIARLEGVIERGEAMGKGAAAGADGLVRSGLFGRSIPGSALEGALRGFLPGSFLDDPIMSKAVQEKNRLERELFKSNKRFQDEKALSQIQESLNAAVAPINQGARLSSATDYPGALEMGTAAAYAAAYQREQQNKEQEKIANNTEKANEFLKQIATNTGKTGTGGQMIRRATV